MTAKGIYIYGFVPNFYSTEMFRSLENSGLSAITYDNISAIISEKDGVSIDYTDRESLGTLLVHHQQTIEELQCLGFTVLIPMRLGTIVKTKEDVFKIFKNGYELITETLKKIQFLTEIDLAVTWADFPGLLKDIASLPEILEMKEKILQAVDKLSQEDQMKAGMLVQSKLKEKNSKVELNILDLLSQVSLDIKTHDVMNDQMITNSAFLINRNSQDKFEQVIGQLDDEYKGALNFRMVGPLPCYSFYTIEIKELNSDHIAQANAELGLKDEVSESEIKKAYLAKARMFHPDISNESSNEENFNRIAKAYHTLLDYSQAVRQSLKGENKSQSKENSIGNLILVKIKE